MESGGCFLVSFSPSVLLFFPSIILSTQVLVSYWPTEKVSGHLGAKRHTNQFQVCPDTFEIG